MSKLGAAKRGRFGAAFRSRLITAAFAVVANVAVATPATAEQQNLGESSSQSCVRPPGNAVAIQHQPLIELQAAHLC